MRIKTHWFRRSHERGSAEVGAAAAMMVWRNALLTVRALSEDGPVTDRPGGHLRMVEELAVFGLQFADRLAWLRGMPDEERRQLVEAMVAKLADLARENSSDETVGWDFIGFSAPRLDAYARTDYEQEQPSFACLNLMARAVCEAGGHERDTWLHARLVEIDGPELVEKLRRGVGGLFENLQRQPG